MPTDWTEFPERVETLGDLISILESLDREQARGAFHFELFAKESDESAYSVSLNAGKCHFEPCPERIPGLEQLLEHIERQHNELSARTLRQIRGCVCEILGRDRATVNALPLTEVAKILSDAEKGITPSQPGGAGPSAHRPGPPNRVAFDEATRLTLDALRAARTLPIHRDLFNRESCTPSLAERCDTVSQLVQAARDAVAPLAESFRAVATYAGDHPFLNKFWPSAHEAAVAAATDLLWSYRPECGDPGPRTEDRVYAELERDIEREHAAALARFCTPATVPAAPPVLSPAPVSIRTLGELLSSVRRVEQAAASTRAEADAMNGAVGSGHLHIQAGVIEAFAEHKKHPAFPVIEAYTNAHYGPATYENLIRVRGVACLARSCGTTEADGLPLEDVVQILSSPGVPREANPPPPTPAPANPAADSGPYTLNDVRDLLRYRSDSATFRARLLSMTPGELTAASFGRAMGIPLHRNIGELFALVEPSPPRLTEDEFVVIPTCRWLTRAAREEGVPLNEDTLRFLLGEVAGVLKRTVPELMALPLDEFDQLRRDAAKATPADKKRVREGGRPKLGEGPKATPQDVALRNVYELIRAAKQDGWGVKALMKHFTEDKAFRGRVRDAGEVWGSALFKNAIAWISDNPEQETQAVNVS